MPSKERPDGLLQKIPELTPSPEIKSPNVVIYAGSSPRRKKFLQHCFPQSEILNFSAGEEKNNHEIYQIMRAKLAVVSPMAKMEMLKRPGKNGIVVASDIESFTIGLEKGGVVATIGRGKPKEVGEVRKMFLEMVKASEIAKSNPYYQVFASSGAQEINNGKSVIRSKDHTCYVELDPDMLKFFGTARGFNTYVCEFLNFFSSPEYSSNGSHPPIGLTDVAGGIDLAVLARLGAVVRVDQNYQNDPGFRENLRYAINHSTIGIHATVLRPFNPNIDDKIQNWQWLGDVTDYALNATT
jgi:hypothetical protein